MPEDVDKKRTSAYKAVARLPVSLKKHGKFIPIHVFLGGSFLFFSFSSRKVTYDWWSEQQELPESTRGCSIKFGST